MPSSVATVAVFWLSRMIVPKRAIMSCGSKLTLSPRAKSARVVLRSGGGGGGMAEARRFGLYHQLVWLECDDAAVLQSLVADVPEIDLLPKMQMSANRHDARRVAQQMADRRVQAQ